MGSINWKERTILVAVGASVDEFGVPFIKREHQTDLVPYCSNCGMRLDGSFLHFCDNCGIKLDFGNEKKEN